MTAIKQENYTGLPLAQLRITPGLLVSMLQTGAHMHVHVKNGLPEDARIIGAQWDHAVGDIILFVKSETKPEFGNEFIPLLTTLYCEFQHEECKR